MARRVCAGKVKTILTHVLRDNLTFKMVPSEESVQWRLLFFWILAILFYFLSSQEQALIKSIFKASVRVKVAT
jgi:hypothetical protein